MNLYFFHLDWFAVAYVLSIYAITYALHAVLPGRTVTGYVCSSALPHFPLKYKLNGVYVFLLVTGGFQLYLTLTPEAGPRLFRSYASVVFAANALGLAVSFFYFSQTDRGERYTRCITRDQVDSRGALKPSATLTLADATFNIHANTNAHTTNANTNSVTANAKSSPVRGRADSNTNTITNTNTNPRRARSRSASKGAKDRSANTNTNTNTISGSANAHSGSDGDGPAAAAPASPLTFFLGREWNPRLRLPFLSYSLSQSNTNTNASTKSGKSTPKSKSKSTSKAAHTSAADSDCVSDGDRENDRDVGVDVKMLLYLVGAVGLGCNVLVCVAAQRDGWHSHSLSRAMAAYALCFTWFLVEYLLGEEVHLYTYDIFAEKIGFKLCWGCLTFYPCFYCVGAFSVVLADLGHPRGDLTALELAATLILFFTGWAITRGANMQKFYFRTQPQHASFLFGLIPQVALPVNGSPRILCSGFWGVARHFNYFGEIVQALALSLPGILLAPSHAHWPLLRLLPLLYPLYYVLLFVPRQLDDDAVCEARYGRVVWDEYRRRVPSRIVPGVW